MINDGGIKTNRIRYYPYLMVPEFQYVGIRTRNGSGYRYGYMKLRVTEEMDLYIQQIAMEKE
jgi:hypothetical protein